MSRDKQIEKMAKIMCDDCAKSNPLCQHNVCDAVLQQAETLYDAGYRKASDVAREIFAEIEKKIASMKYNANTPRKTVRVEELKEQVDWVLHEVVPNTIADLKKKYESEGADDEN